MDREARTLSEHESRETVVPLGAEVAPGHGDPPRPGAPASRLHAVSITGMALSALAGIASMLAFVTVRWSGPTGHYVVGAVILSAVAFLAFASIAVFTAARDTYASRGVRRNETPRGE